MTEISPFNFVTDQEINSPHTTDSGDVWGKSANGLMGDVAFLYINGELWVRIEQRKGEQNG